MKALLLSIAFCSIATLCSAQLAMNTANTNDAIISTSNRSTTAKEEAALKMIQKHNRSAAKQLGTYLNKQLQYSSIMQSNCMEGKVIIEISLSEAGNILDAKIVKSLNPEADKVVTEAMSNLSAIQFKNKEYRGNKRIRIPIDFTMR